MKLMIASDIHGSAHYCRKMTEAYRREQADRLLLLGDILYHGPRNDLPENYDPKEVIALLNPLKNELLCVRGNCDTEVDQMVHENMGTYTYMNPGSVSIPKENSARGYMLYDKKFLWKDLDGAVLNI